MFSKKSDEWATPQALFDTLDKQYHFEFDAAASALNTKCELWSDDSLDMDWCRWRTWLNPPYSLCKEFVAKARLEADKGATVVLLLPSRTDTKWWHQYIWDTSEETPRPGVGVNFIKGRVKFEDGKTKNSAPFPSVLVEMWKAE